MARFIGAPSPSERRLHQERDRGHQPGRLHAGAGPTWPPGDVVVLTEIEHHANLVPWLMLRGGARHRAALPPDGRRLHARPRPTSTQLLDGAKLLGVTAMSNVLGTLDPGARSWPTRPTPPARSCLVDGAQLVPHLPDRRDRARAATSSASPATRCSARPASGVLWARRELLEAMPPFLGGGEMIRDVRLDGLTPNDIPWKFEAGTPPIAEVDRPRRGRRLPRRHSGMDAVRAARDRAHRLRPAHARRTLRRRARRSTAPPTRRSAAA